MLLAYSVVLIKLYLRHRLVAVSTCYWSHYTLIIDVSAHELGRNSLLAILTRNPHRTLLVMLLLKEPVEIVSAVLTIDILFPTVVCMNLEIGFWHFFETVFAQDNLWLVLLFQNSLDFDIRIILLIRLNHLDLWLN